MSLKIKTCAVFIAVVLIVALPESSCTSVKVQSERILSSNPTTTLPISSSLKVINEQHVSSRLINFTMKTNALSFIVHLDVLLPSDYASNPKERYPVIYLLHGGTSGPNTGMEYQQWIDSGNATALTANLPVICVMPEAGSGGWYTNWYNNGKGGSPQWQTFHVLQLVPFIDHNFRTVDNRNDRAIVGLSMGGYGSFEYASQFPDIFGIAASFSGAVDIAYPPNVAGPMAKVIVGIMAKGDGGTPTSPFGSFSKNQIIWRGHDPADLVQNLSNTKLLLFTGNGTPGPLDDSATTNGFSTGIEKIVYLSTVEMEFQLLKYHIKFYADNYDPGTHSWPYWQRDLQLALPMILADFNDKAAWPTQFTYSSISDVFSQWGYTVTFRRKDAEFGTLVQLSKTHFLVKGSGSANITTPAFFSPNTKFAIQVQTKAANSSVLNHLSTVTSNSKGQLNLSLYLGPSNTITEYSPDWVAKNTKIYTASVTVS